MMVLIFCSFDYCCLYALQVISMMMMFGICNQRSFRSDDSNCVNYSTNKDLLSRLCYYCYNDMTSYKQPCVAGLPVSW